MGKTTRPARKPYRRPALQRYGDFRTLTGGGGKNKDESNILATHKTRAGTG